jgi:hypothetical protein
VRGVQTNCASDRMYAGVCAAHCIGYENCWPAMDKSCLSIVLIWWLRSSRLFMTFQSSACACYLFALLAANFLTLVNSKFEVYDDSFVLDGQKTRLVACECDPLSAGLLVYNPFHFSVTVSA